MRIGRSQESPRAFGGGSNTKLLAITRTVRRWSALQLARGSAPNLTSRLCILAFESILPRSKQQRNTRSRPMLSLDALTEAEVAGQLNENLR